MTPNPTPKPPETPAGEVDSAGCAASSGSRSLEAMYQMVVAACLRCDPIPACKRADDQLEPPWEVIDRILDERNTARVVATDAIRELDRILDTGDTYASRQVVQNLQDFLRGDSSENAEVKCGDSEARKTN